MGSTFFLRISKMWERLGLSVMQKLDPERAHGLAIAALKSGLLPAPGAVT